MTRFVCKQPDYRATQMMLVEGNWKGNRRLPVSSGNRSLSWVHKTERSGERNGKDFEKILPEALVLVAYEPYVSY